MNTNKSISKKYTDVFNLIDKAGGVKLEKQDLLTAREKSEVCFNTYAFLFGVFYYIAKGMWKKGIVLLLLSMGLSDVLNLIVSFFITPPTSGMIMGIGFISQGAIFGSRATIDLYKKHRLNENGWL